MRVPPGSQLVFDQIVTDASKAYSDPKFNDWLGRANDISLFLVADRVSVPGIAGLLVFVQEASDEERAWTAYSNDDASPNIDGSVVTGQTTILKGVSSGDITSRAARPSLAFRRLEVQLLPDGTGSAHVRIWVAGRNGYRTFNRLLIAERVEGTGAVYAAQEACSWIAGPDALAFAVLTEEVSPAPPNSPSLNLLLAESPNARTWNEFAGSIPIQSGTFFPSAFSVDLAPLSAFKRFGVQLIGTNPAATVRLWVTGRDVRSG